jgi:predicted nuclease of restriction endonuclease-like (RecB) superfamily
MAKAVSVQQKKLVKQHSKVLYKEIAQLIEVSKANVVRSVNKELTLLNWHIGKQLFTIIDNAENKYGLEIVATVSQLLQNKYGKGYTISSLSRMQQFFQFFPKIKIVATLSQLLSWSHFAELVNVKNDLARSYYTELCKIEHWNVRELRDRINIMLYERTAISKKPEKLIKQELKLLQQQKSFTENIVFRDEYLLDFLDLKDVYSEKDLESAILIELQKFIIEIGNDFAFLSRQKRMIIDGEDYSLDLLFYHRGLNRLIAIELKLGKFKASYKAQMQLYLRWLEKYEMRNHEELPIGLILCTENSKEIIELLMADEKRIKVANYTIELPEAKIIKRKLQKAISNAKAKLNIK